MTVMQIKIVVFAKEPIFGGKLYIPGFQTWNNHSIYEYRFEGQNWISCNIQMHVAQKVAWQPNLILVYLESS